MHSKRTAKAILVISLTLLFVVPLLAGCGGTSNLSEGSAHQMIVQDGKEVRAYLAEMKGILKSKASSIQQRKSAMSSAPSQYEVFWPGVFEEQGGAAWNKAVEASRRKKAIYGTLYGLAEKKLVAQNGQQSNAKSVPAYISDAAVKYYVAVDNLNSLKSFEDMLSQYTTGDGTKVNRDNPPPKGTSTGLGAFGGANFGLDWDPATGDVKLFKYDADPSLTTSGKPVTVREMEQYFIDSAKARIAEADGMVEKRSAAQ
jgi:hypothetical protein